MDFVQISYCSERILIYSNTPENKPPPLENITTCELVANNLNAIHAARKVFIETEASEKSRRAILRKARPSKT